jgi:hypothetical protein
VFVALVVGVHGDGRVAEDGLRAGGGNRKKLAAIALHRVLEKVQKAVLVRILHLRAAATAQVRVQFLVGARGSLDACCMGSSDVLALWTVVPPLCAPSWFALIQSVGRG